MGKLIDTSELDKHIALQKKRFGMLEVPICNIFTDMIRDTPTVEAIPKADYEARFKTGKWIVHRKSDGEVGYFQCSSCNHHSVVKFPYCPICGAEMDCSPNILSEMKAIPRDIYENRLKADMVAMLKDLDLQIDELSFSDEEPINITQDYIDELRSWEYGKNGCKKLIQQKINELKGETK